MVDAYANALYVLASEQNQVEQIGQQLADLVNLVDQVDQMKAFLKHPSIQRSQKEQVLLACLPDQEGLLARFMKILAQMNQANDLEKLYMNYQEEVRQAQGIQLVKVTSAKQLDTAFVEQLKALLEKKLSQKIELKLEIDPSVVAGLKISGKEFVLDNTLETKAQAIARAILE